MVIGIGSAIASNLIIVNPVYISALYPGQENWSCTSCNVECTNVGTRNCEVRVITTSGIKSTNGYSDNQCTVILKQTPATATVNCGNPQDVVTYAPNR